MICSWLCCVFCSMCMNLPRWIGLQGFIGETKNILSHGIGLESHLTDTAKKQHKCSCTCRLPKAPAVRALGSLNAMYFGRVCKLNYNGGGCLEYEDQCGKRWQVPFGKAAGCSVQKVGQKASFSLRDVADQRETIDISPATEMLDANPLVKSAQQDHDVNALVCSCWFYLGFVSG